MTFSLKFFIAVVPPSVGVVVAWSTLLGLGAWWGWKDDLATTGLLTGCLYFQMLAVSAGFMRDARAGYFDEVLRAGRPRWMTAVAHWIVVSGPGVAVWLLLGCIEAFGSSADPAALRLSSLAALFWVSTFAWLLSLPFGRWSGGLLWTSGLILLAASEWGGDLLSRVGGATSSSTGFAMVTGTTAVSPFLLLTPIEVAPARGGALAVAILVMSVVALVAGAAIVHWRDYPLEFRR